MQVHTLSSYIKWDYELHARDSTDRFEFSALACKPYFQTRLSNDIKLPDNFRIGGGCFEAEAKNILEEKTVSNNSVT